MQTFAKFLLHCTWLYYLIGDFYDTPGIFWVPSAVDVNSWHPGGLISDGSMNRKQSPLHGTVPSDSHGNSR